MNRKLSILSALSAAAIVGLFASGCALGSGSPLVGKPTVEQVPVTNIVDGVPHVELISQTNTVWSVNTNWTASIGTARTVNEIANPTPTAPLVNLGLGALVAGLGWWARIKNQKAKGAEELVDTLIAGVEHANNQDVKKSIEAEATRRGVNSELHSKVREL